MIKIEEFSLTQKVNVSQPNRAIAQWPHHSVTSKYIFHHFPYAYSHFWLIEIQIYTWKTCHPFESIKSGTDIIAVAWNIE